MLISIIGNILIIVVIKKTKEFRRSQYVYKKSIAVSDILWTFSACVISVYFVYNFGNTIYTCQLSNLSNKLVKKNNFTAYRDVYCAISDIKMLGYGFEFTWLFVVFVMISGFLMLISVTVSLVLLIFAAADRYYALSFPFRYKSTNTIKLAKTSTIIIWIISTLLNVFTVIFNSIKNKRIIFTLQPLNKKDAFNYLYNPNLIFVSVLVFLLFLLLWLLTFLTLVSLYKSYKISLKLNRRTRKKKSSEKQMSLVLIFMVLAFTISLSPTLYNHVLMYMSISDSTKNENVIFVQPYIAILFLLTNSV